MKNRRQKIRKTRYFILIAILLCFISGFFMPMGLAADLKDTVASAASKKFTLSSVAAYRSDPYVTVNNNNPYFTARQKANKKSYEKYADLDSLGRCQAAIACVGSDLMPAGERGSIGSVKPTGWHTVKYSIVDGRYLYNRCHLIGYQLTAENANKENLITGTRYLNIEGMLPFENMVADYIKETDNHVLYRVTPEFKGNNLVASGVLMEAYSVEDKGEGICFCVYCYNVQPGITINYSDGDSSLTSDKQSGSKEQETAEQQSTAAQSGKTTYVLNTNTMKFHKLTCSSVKRMSTKNKQLTKKTRSELIKEGYSPCKVCNP
jgi:DNA-entry nuclease